MEALYDIDLEEMLDLEPSCEFSNHVPLGHTGPAFYVVKFNCIQCPRVNRFLMCIDCFVKSQEPGMMVECAECGTVTEGRDVIRLVHIL